MIIENLVILKNKRVATLTYLFFIKSFSVNVCYLDKTTINRVICLYFINQFYINLLLFSSNLKYYSL